MIAFGGAAPIHAARLAEKLDIVTVIVPAGAGVGSAFGFLLAPIAYEVVRTRFGRLDATFDVAALNALRAGMRSEAEAVVRLGAPTAALTEGWTANMRYRGQGHEVTVAIPPGEHGRELRGRAGAAVHRGLRAAVRSPHPGPRR